MMKKDVIGSSKEESLPDKAPAVSLFDFGGSDPAWFPVNDNVMGGLSSGLVKVDSEKRRLSFYGNLSLENNGGFASIRSTYAAPDLTAFEGIALKLRGDGKRYRFRIRTEQTGPEVTYTAHFETEANVWQEVHIRFSEMVPTYRGVLVQDLNPLDPSSIRSFGFMIADKQQGDFLLEVDAISAVANIAAVSLGTSG